jgi:putative flippase GtrA
VLSTVASTEANRRFTFRGVTTDRAREYVQNAGTVAFYAVYSSAVLLVVETVIRDATALQESVAVAAASVLGGAVRFVVLRNWVFGEGSGRVAPGGDQAEWRDDAGDRPAPSRPAT